MTETTDRSDLHDIAFEARIRLRREQTAEQLTAELVSLGFGQAQSQAAAVEATTRRDKRDKKDNRTAGLANAGIGAVLLIVGLAITIGTMMGDGGGYVITIGAIGIGAWRLFLGLAQLFGAKMDDL